MKVGYSVTDSLLAMTIPAILDSFQDAATFDAESGICSMKNLADRRLVWLLSSWQIVIERYPRLYENIVVTTSPYDFKGFIGYRNFWITGEDGEKIVKAASIWTLVDTDKLRPTKLPEDIAQGYCLGEKLDMEYAPRKIVLKGEATEGDSFRIRKFQIDSNRHVNNAEYVRLAMEAIPQDCKINEVRVEYKKSAHYGDILKIRMYNSDAATRQVALEDENGEITAVVEFHIDL
jgi:acyl-ACP thioesterase